MRLIDGKWVLDAINERYRSDQSNQSDQLGIGLEIGLNDGLQRDVWEITHTPAITEMTEPLTGTRRRGAVRGKNRPD